MKRLACALLSTLCLMTASTGLALTAEDHNAFCAQSPEYSRADKELNAVWKRLRKELPKARYKEIQAEQRNWIGGLRDREALQHGGATAKGYALATQARVAYLRQLLAETGNAPATTPAVAKAVAPAQPPAASARPALSSAPEQPAPASPRRNAVAVTPATAATPVTHAEIPATQKPAAVQPTSQAPVVSVTSSSATGGMSGASEASGIIVQTSSSKEVAPMAQAPAPGLQSPSATLQQAAPTAQQAAPATPQLAAQDDIPPLQQAAPVKVNTSNALDPEKEQSLRKKKGQAKATPKTRVFTGFPKEYQNAGHKHVRLDNAKGKPILQVGTWGNFSTNMQNCLHQAIQSGAQVEVEGVAHSFSDGSVMMRADSPLVCRNK
ncbi:hypothetical protein LJC46_04100 [Desulfovibrio sp. OttesenSCG-928-G15]|nr:hypothetical protein [Desulfovibrio sp. OttesenSCG-928-G15]